MRRVDRVWETCPEGEIRRLVLALRGTQQRRLMARLLIAAAGTVLLATIWLLIRFLS